MTTEAQATGIGNTDHVRVVTPTEQGPMYSKPAGSTVDVIRTGTVVHAAETLEGELPRPIISDTRANPETPAAAAETTNKYVPLAKWPNMQVSNGVPLEVITALNEQFDGQPIPHDVIRGLNLQHPPKEQKAQKAPIPNPKSDNLGFATAAVGQLFETTRRQTEAKIPRMRSEGPIDKKPIKEKEPSLRENATKAALPYVAAVASDVVGVTLSATARPDTQFGHNKIVAKIAKKQGIREAWDYHVKMGELSKSLRNIKQNQLKEFTKNALVRVRQEAAKSDNPKAIIASFIPIEELAPAAINLLGGVTTEAVSATYQVAANAKSTWRKIRGIPELSDVDKNGVTALEDLLPQDKKTADKLKPQFNEFAAIVAGDPDLAERIATLNNQQPISVQLPVAA